MRGNQKIYGCVLLAVVLLLPLSVGMAPVPVLHDVDAVSEDACEADVVPLENPQVEDRRWDVKIFGLLPILPQWYLRHVDIVSAMFYEASDTPASLYLSLELRDLQDATVLFEAVYAVGWTLDNTHYGTVLHVRPDGVHNFLVGRSIDGDDDIEEWELCEGTFDAAANVLTWKMPKTAIGNPPQGARLKNIHPHTHLRPTGEATLPPIDLFKDLSHNARTTTEYTIQY